MSNQNGNNFSWVYESYLAWFHSKARPGASPEEQESILGRSLCQEDVYESADTVLNRIFFAIPLPPSKSVSGQLELFVFSELNLMQRSVPCGDGDFSEIYPTEYMVL